MAGSEIEKCRRDIDTIESALGLDRQWTRDAIRMSLLFAVAGLIAAVWANLPHGLSPVWGFASFILPVFVWARTANRATQSDEAGDVWREIRAALGTLWLLLPLAGLFVWTRYMELDLVQYLGLAVFLVGVVLFSAAVGNRHERWLAGWSLALMAGGLLTPTGLAHPVTLIAAAIGAGGLISTAICVYLPNEK